MGQYNLFKKIAIFTDLHIGNKGNSQIHNKDCEDYIDWFIKTAKENNCDTALCMGDYHHNRNALNIITLDYSIRCLEKLGQAFEHFYFFPGNHDLFFKDKRDIHSVEFGKYIPGITIINKPTMIDNTVLCPWLVGDEWKNIGKKLKGQYIFGHFELPHFFMNAMVQMPDHGDLKLNQFKNYEYGFSGHFHKRQQIDNMIYIGNAFPHNYSDAWDDARGMMILEWGGTPQYFTWNEQPTFRTLTLSRLIDESDKILKPKQFLKVLLDIDISFEEASFIKETYVDKYQLRELKLINEKKSIEFDNITINQNLISIDQMVSTELANINSESYDKNLLLRMYNEL